MANDYAKEVAERVIEALEQGTAPWQKPWLPGELRAPFNPKTGNPYRGMNTIWLQMQGHSDPRWLTYKQAGEMGAQVRRGSKGTRIEYWKFHDEREQRDDAGNPVLDENGRPRKIRVELDRPRRFTAVVFNGSQVDGLAPYSAPTTTAEPERHERAETILEQSGASIRHVNGDRAYYSPADDRITLPERQQFLTPDRYYATALHELGHWTGHESRLDRDLAHPFGSQGYAKEELRAEIASLMIGEKLEIGHDPGQHVAYVKSWIKVLQDDPREIFRAASDAEKISGHVMQFERYLTEEEKLFLADQEAKARDEQSAAQAGPASSEQDKLPITYQLTNRKQHGEDAPRFDSLAEAMDAYRNDKNPILDCVGIRATNENGSFSVLDHDWYNDGSNHRHTFVAPEVEQYLSVLNNQKDASAVDLAKAEAAAVQAVEDRAARGARTDQRALPGRERTPANLSQNNAQQKEAEAMTRQRTYLAVPYSEKNNAKKFGARWDAKAKSWYAPEGTQLKTSGLARWLPQKALAQDKPDAEPPEQVFADELRKHGLVLDGPPIMDGKLHRVPVEGDKGSEKSGAYVGHLDGKIPAGFVQNYKSGEANNWRYPENGVAPMTDAERAEAQAVAAANKQKREAEKVAGQERAKYAATALWAEAPAATSANPYCTKKGIDVRDELGLRTVPGSVSAETHAAGIRIAKDHREAKSMRDAEPNTWVFQRGDLLVPLYDGKGETVGVQSVNPYFKGFMKGAKKGGLYSVAGGTPDALNAKLTRDPDVAIVICEGYSTGDAVAGAMRHPVVVALDSGNLDSVARQMREKYPDRPLVIAADNDRNQKNPKLGNVGLKMADSAAKKHGGAVAAPRFAPGSKGSDWNDYARELGEEQGKRGIFEAVHEAKVKATMNAAKIRNLAHERMADAVDNPATAADNPFVASQRDQAQTEINAATADASAIRAAASRGQAAVKSAQAAPSASSAMGTIAMRDRQMTQTVKDQRADVLDGTSNSSKDDPETKVKLGQEAPKRRMRLWGRGR